MDSFSSRNIFTSLTILPTNPIRLRRTSYLVAYVSSEGGVDIRLGSIASSFSFPSSSLAFASSTAFYSSLRGVDMIFAKISSTFSATKGTDHVNISEKLGRRYGCSVYPYYSIVKVSFMNFIMAPLLW